MSFKAVFADVGQGDSTLLELPDGRFMLVDVYRCPGNGIDLFKLLDDVLPDGDDGKKRLEHLVITHAHDDHITGMGDLYDRYDVKYLWLPQHEDRKQIASNFEEYQRVEDEHPDEDTLKPKGSRTPISETYDQLDLGEDMTLRCFSPPGYIDVEASLTQEEAKKLVHENCLVIRVSYKGQSVMLTGDSDLACWQRIVDYYEGRPADETGTDVLEAEVLHASHHGSRTFFKEGGEDSDPWLTALELIEPDFVVVSVGEDNRHEHPDPDMMDAYRAEAGDENVLETKDSGTVVFEVGDDGNGALYADTGSYAEDYAWDDDDDDDSDPSDDPSGGTSARSIRQSRTRLDNSAAA